MGNSSTFAISSCTSNLTWKKPLPKVDAPHFNDVGGGLAIYIEAPSWRDAVTRVL